MDLECGRSTALSTSDLGVPDMARPLPCWCRTGRYVPLDENPLIRWVRRQREVQSERFNREGSNGVGRGRPLLVFSSSESSSSDDDTDYGGAYRRIQERVVLPSRRNNSEQHPAGRVFPPGPQSSRWGSSRTVNTDSSASTQHRAEDPRRGFAAASAGPRAVSSSAAMRVRYPPLTTTQQALRGRSAVAPRTQQHGGASGEAASASGHGSGGRGDEFLTLRTWRTQMQAAQQSTRRMGSFDPDEFTHAFDLSHWRQSWPEARSRGTAQDDEEEDEEKDEDEEYEEDDDQYDDDEEDEGPSIRPIPGLSSLEEEDDDDDDDSFSSAVSVLSSELSYSTVASASSTPGQATPATATPESTSVELVAIPQPRAYTRCLEIRRLVEPATAESVFDAVSSFTPVDDVFLFRADGGLGAHITLLEEVPLDWISMCAEAALTVEGRPKPLVFAHQLL